MMANIRHYHAFVDRNQYADEVFKGIMQETDPIIYSNPNGDDEISKELNVWVEKLKKYRKKQ